MSGSYDLEWRQKYKSLICTAEQAVAGIRPGQRVFIGTGCAQPQELVRALTACSAQLANTEIISLLTVGPALVEVTTPDADLVLLAKPQFEAGRSAVGKGGVVRDPEVHAEVLRRLAVGLRELGLPVVDAIQSPLLGADGNREFLLQVRRGGSAWEAARVAALAGDAR